MIDNKANYKILLTFNFTEKTVQSKHYLHYSFRFKKKWQLISIKKIHSIKNISYIQKKNSVKKRFISTKLNYRAHAIITLIIISSSSS